MQQHLAWILSDDVVRITECSNGRKCQSQNSWKETQLVSQTLICKGVAILNNVLRRDHNIGQILKCPTNDSTVVTKVNKAPRQEA